MDRSDRHHRQPRPGRHTAANGPKLKIAQGIEPSDGLRLTLYDLDAEDGTPTFLDGELFWDDDRGEWLAAFEKGGFRTVRRAG
jgi:hypothetical protein